MNGCDVARKVRENVDLSGVFLVALTGYGASGDIGAAREARFDEHITKPADAERLEHLFSGQMRS